VLKTTAPIEVPFGVWIRENPGNHVFVRGPDPPAGTRTSRHSRTCGRHSQRYSHGGSTQSTLLGIVNAVRYSAENALVTHGR